MVRILFRKIDLSYDRQFLCQRIDIFFLFEIQLFVYKHSFYDRIQPFDVNKLKQFLLNKIKISFGTILYDSISNRFDQNKNILTD